MARITIQGIEIKQRCQISEKKKKKKGEGER